MDTTQLTAIKDAFVNELRQAAQGVKTSLPFISHTLSTHSLVKPGEQFQVLVIGGSYYQQAVMQAEGTKLTIISRTQGAQPVFTTKQHLMDFILTLIDKEIHTIAINFAYSLTPVNREGRLDGALQFGSKENTFEGLVGEQIGEQVEQFLAEKTGSKFYVTAANDTICLLLSGLTSHRWSELAAGIVGTGLNFALFESVQHAVNLESGSFDKFTQSEAGREIDHLSAVPGDAIYEKEVSGAYLFRHFNYEIKKKGIAMDPIGSSQQLDFLVTAPTEEIATIAKQTLQHSAQLVGAQVAGILEYQQRDLVFVMQGSMYWKGYKYKETVDEAVKMLCPHYKATYINILQSDLFGAAKLII